MDVGRLGATAYLAGLLTLSLTTNVPSACSTSVAVPDYPERCSGFNLKVIVTFVSPPVSTAAGSCAAREAPPSPSSVPTRRGVRVFVSVDTRSRTAAVKRRSRASGDDRPLDVTAVTLDLFLRRTRKLDRGHATTIIECVRPKAWWLSLAAAMAIALAIVLFMSTRDADQLDPDDELVAGQIYSTDAGDPLGIVYETDDPGTGCVALSSFPNDTSGIPYGGTTRCLTLEEIDQDGMYLVLLPESAEDPALVAGVMPSGATGATVSGIGWTTTRAALRGRWFLASLLPATPDIANLEPFRVRFDY